MKFLIFTLFSEKKRYPEIIKNKGTQTRVKESTRLAKFQFTPSLFNTYSAAVCSKTTIQHAIALT